MQLVQYLFVLTGAAAVIAKGSPDADSAVTLLSGAAATPTPSSRPTKKCPAKAKTSAPPKNDDDDDKQPPVSTPTPVGGGMTLLGSGAAGPTPTPSASASKEDPDSTTPSGGKHKPADSGARTAGGDKISHDDDLGWRSDGLATMYGGYDKDVSKRCHEEDCWQNGACLFGSDYHLPPGIDGSTSTSQFLWENGTNCGACIELINSKGTTQNKVKLMVTNASGGLKNSLDNPPETYDKIAKGTVAAKWGGVDSNKWRWTSCGLDLPLRIFSRWGSIIVYDGNRATVSIEARCSGEEEWRLGMRGSINGVSWKPEFKCPVDLRLTSDQGDVITFEKFNLANGNTATASGNYPKQDPPESPHDD